MNEGVTVAIAALIIVLCAYALFMFRRPINSTKIGTIDAGIQLPLNIKAWGKYTAQEKQEKAAELSLPVAEVEKLASPQVTWKKDKVGTLSLLYLCITGVIAATPRGEASKIVSDLKLAIWFANELSLDAIVIRRMQQIQQRAEGYVKWSIDERVVLIQDVASLLETLVIYIAAAEPDIKKPDQQLLEHMKAFSSAK